MLNCDAKLIWAAACAAQRIQGKYIKVTDVLQENQVPNRSIMLDLISSDDDNGILQEDYDLAENIKTFYSRLTFKMLTDEPMNNFKKEILKLVSAETITNIYQLTVLASIPSTYVREAKYDIIKNKISNATGNLFGVVKSNVELDIEIVKAFPSNHYYNTCCTTAITSNNQLIFFCHKMLFEVGTKMQITGKIKEHTDTLTKLHYVTVKLEKENTQ